MKRAESSTKTIARRVMLLWSPQDSQGRSGLTLKAIVSTGIEVADESGVEALTMRRVAEHLAVGTMSLYTHVPSKTELLDLMIDAVYGELYQSADEPSLQGGWREGLRFIALRNWEAYRRHPWMLQVVSPRPALGPRACMKYEAELRPLDGIGLTDIEMDATLSLVLAHVEACVRALEASKRVERDSKMTDAEWWIAAAPYVERVIDLSRFPVSSRVGSAAGNAYGAASSPEYALDFGIERIIDGIADLIANSGEKTGASL